MKPELISFDYETVEILPDGSTTASTEMYRENFRVTDCAFAWRDESGEMHTRWVQGEAAIEVALIELVCDGPKSIVYNAQFEKAVTRCRFPQLYDRITWYCDAMRLVQNFDNGEETWLFEDLPDVSDEPVDLTEKPKDSAKVAKAKSIGGVGLAKATQRILKEPDPKAATYKYLREVCGVKKGTEGANLHLLPPDKMAEYNIGDAINTLRLYEFCTEDFKAHDYDWTLDHALYMSTVDLLVKAKIKGVPVDREKAKANAQVIEAEIAEIDRAFKERFASELRTVERGRLLKRIRKLKSLRGRRNFVRRYRGGDPGARKEVAFNVGSNDQLASLFIDVLGIQPKFFTDKSKPAFRSAVLGSYGEGGLMLGKRRKRLIVLKQLQSLIRLTAYDGRAHFDLKAAGTATGRFSGGNQS